MIYLNKEDLIDTTIERLIDESVQNNPAIIDNVELKQIGVITTYLGSRYNVSTIFDSVTPIENEVLKDILARLVMFKLIKRNAARKVPNDYKDSYDAAMKQLKEIATGVVTLNGVPTAVNTNGTPKSNSISGNLSNPNFYI